MRAGLTTAPAMPLSSHSVLRQTVPKPPYLDFLQEQVSNTDFMSQLGIIIILLLALLFLK